MQDEGRMDNSLVKRRADVCNRFASALKAGDQPRLEDYLQDAAASDRDDLLRDLLLLDLEHRARQGDSPEVSGYRRRFPQQPDVVASVWNEWQARQRRQGDATRSAGSTAHGELTETWKPAGGDDEREPPPTIPGFEVLEPLGQGGMGMVVKARHLQLGRMVAIKMPLLGKLGSRARERFLREARAAAGLNHPHICPIYEVGEVDGRPYIEMAYIDGVSLKEWAAAGDVTQQQAAEVVAALARAVAYAHDQGVIHRDIKPGNVMVDSKTANPVLMDFGLAKEVAGGDAELTQAGQVLGTPAYMAPEQAAGTTAQIGPPADVYALGGVLYALLTGRAPFQGGVASVLQQVQLSEPKPPRSFRRGLHRDLETICLKAMAKQPEQRYESALALAEDLDRYRAGEVIQARRAGPLKRTAKWVRRHPVAAVGTVAACLLVGLAVVLVQRALAERRVTTQVHRFSGLLAQFDGSSAGHERLTGSLEALRRLDEEQADFARGSLVKRYEELIQQSLQGALDEQDKVTVIEGMIARLEKFAPQRGASMRRILDQRQRTFSEVFDLATPFEGVNRVFRADQVKRSSEALRPAGPESDGPVRRVSTTRRSRGNVELAATFAAESRETARTLGLSLNAGSQHTYEFLVTIPAVDDAARGRMSIVKNGVALAAQELPQGTGDLQLTARREGNRLSFRVDNAPLLRFDDMFGLTSKVEGYFGVVWARNAKLTRLTARRQSLPVVSSPLEDADLLFQTGDFEAALRGYEDQLRQVATEDLRQEARCKMGLCRLQLKQNDAAAKALDELAAEAHPRWSMVAACHLWSLRLEQQDYDAADRIFAYLENRFSFEDLATLLPQSLLHRLLLVYADEHRGPNLFGFDEADLRRLEHGMAVARLLTGKSNIQSRIGLLRGHRALVQRSRALQIGAELLGDKRWLQAVPVESRLLLVEEQCWMLRREGRAPRALALLDEWISGRRGISSTAAAPLRIERARCHAELDAWEDAEQDIQAYFEQVAPGDVRYRLYSAACLIEGFLRRRRGDEQGAREIWEQGLYEVWREARTNAGHDVPALPAAHYDQFSGMEFHQYVVLSCLAGQMTEDDIRSAIKWAMFRQKNSPLAVLISTAAGIKMREVTSVFNNMCSTEFGRAKARQIAFQQIDFREFIRYPMYLFCVELVRRGAFGGELTPQQQQLAWEAAQHSCRGVESGEIPQVSLGQLLATWEFQTGFVGWGGVKKSLDPTVRGKIAYVLGYRFLQRGNSEDAREFFRTARQDGKAVGDQRLEELADEALQGLKE